MSIPPELGIPPEPPPPPAAGRWPIAHASDVLATITEPLRERGWLVGLYGSTITRGDGRDLDLILAPWRGDASRSVAEAILMDQISVVVVDRHESAWDQSLGVAYRTSEGRVIDVLYVNRVDDRDVV